MSGRVWRAVSSALLKDDVVGLSHDREPLGERWSMAAACQPPGVNGEPVVFRNHRPGGAVRGASAEFASQQFVFHRVYCPG